MYRPLAALLVAGAIAQPNPCGTGQVRLALTSATDGSEMRVAWATGNTTTPARYAGVVKYGRSPGALTMTSAAADSRNYTLCELASVHLHSAVMTGLAAGETFYYSVTEPRCGATAPVKFTAPRAVGDKATAYPFTVFAYGDMGVTNSQPVIDLIAERVGAGSGPDVVTHAGDISYADNRRCPRYDSVQDLYYDMISAYASHTPVMFSSGSVARARARAGERSLKLTHPSPLARPCSNHEIFGADAKGDFLAYRTRVSPTMPIADPIATPFWYSFNAGRVHFLAFDIDQPYEKGSAQYDFILADLKAVDRSVTPIVYAYEHFPLFCTNFFWCIDEKTGEAAGKPAAFRALYEPIFNAPETRVHVFVAGHVHAAEIAFPVATGSLVPSQKDFKGISTTFYAMFGFPGDEEVCCNGWITPKPALTAWRTDDVAKDGGTFGFGEFEFTSDTSFTFKAWSGVNKTVLFQTDVTFA